MTSGAPVLVSDNCAEALARHGVLPLQGYGMRTGLQLLRRGRLKRSLRYLVVPVNYWRAAEFGLALGQGDFRPGARVLDVGSPKLLSLFLADRACTRVVATDIEDYFIPEFELLREARGLSPDRLSLRVEDGRRLSFADASFDRVYSISVLEHIPGDGDSECVREIGRVLAPGGRCVITVPFWPAGRVDWRDPDFYWSGSTVEGSEGKVFFQRRYSEAQLRERLIEPSGLRLSKLRFVGERVLAGSEREFCEFLRPPTGPLQPLLSWLLLTRPVADWRSLGKPLCALIVLERAP